MANDLQWHPRHLARQAQTRVDVFMNVTVWTVRLSTKHKIIGQFGFWETGHRQFFSAESAEQCSRLFLMRGIILESDELK